MSHRTTRLILALCAAFLLAASALLGVEPSIFRVPLRIAPTARQVESLPALPLTWTLTAQALKDMPSRLTAAGFSPDLTDALAARVRPKGETADFEIKPDRELLDRFSTSERIRWHRFLSGHPANYVSRWPLVIRVADLAALSELPGAETIAADLYRWGSFLPDGSLRFQDWWVLVPALQNAPGREEILTRLFASDVPLAKLSQGSNDQAKIHAAAVYWQAGGRHGAIESILQAVSSVQGQDRVDIAHFLPRLPRALLNTYPQDFANPIDPGQRSGLIASMFFAADAATMDMDQSSFSQWLAAQCDPLADDTAPTVGDIAVFENPAYTPWPYAAVYLADGLLFGRRPIAEGPWSIIAQDDVGRLNPRLAETPIRYFRPRSLATIGSSSAEHHAPPSPGMTPLMPHGEGPWGRLWSYEIFLPPSASLLARLPAPEGAPLWRLRGLTVARLDAILRDPDFDPAIRRNLNGLLRTQLIPGEDAVIRPARDLVLALPASVRSQLYAYLVFPDDPRSPTQQIRVDPAALAKIRPELSTQIEKLVYLSNGSHVLADYGIFHSLFTDPSERAVVLQMLSRTPVRIVLLERPDAGAVAAAETYWSHDQRKNIGSLLEAFSRNDAARYIDIIHLLPPLARELMNLFTLPVRGQPTPSCYWTAMNFQRDEPDPRFMVTVGGDNRQENEVNRTLRENYIEVEHPDQLGDVIAYYDRGQTANPFHVCTHVAADIVFTKNGYGYNSPWALMTAADVDALYLDPARVVKRYFRAKPAN